VPTALDRRVAYYGEYLSENIAETPEGYRICKNAVIARSGYQKYKVSELADPEGLLGERYSPDDEIDVWRDPAEVFAPATIASFEGKTFTLTHPDELLEPDNDSRHNQGHIQNVRKGTEALEDGNIPLLADIIVKGPESIRAIETGQRELSCGYTYRLAREGYRWDQREIRGNHVALVQHGRAGDEARINDSAPEKEKPAVKNIFSHLFGLGVKEYAKDAKPEELADALKDPDVLKFRGVALDDDRKYGKDDDDDKRHGRDDDKKHAKDDDDDKKHGKDDGMEEENRAAMDRRKKFHDALDRRLDAEEEKEKEKVEDDKEVLDALSKMFSAKDDDDDDKHGKDDDAHPEGCRCSDCMDDRKAKDAEEEKEEKKEEEGEDAEIVREEPVLAEGDRPKSVFDAQTVRGIVADAQLALLNLFKPMVARSKDKQLIKAFDTASTSARALVKKANGNGSYALFQKAASKINDKAIEEAKDSGGKDWKPRVSPAEQRMQEYDQIYAEAGKKSREKTNPLAARR